MVAIPSLPKQYHKASVWALYVIGLMPAAWYFYSAVNGHLGAFPAKTLMQYLGLWAFRFLLLSLLVTPLRDLFDINWLRYRRALGLLAFYNVMLHFIVYFFLVSGMDLATIGKDILFRPFITLGMVAILLLIPLAVTSNSWSIKRLGARWNKLHKLAYGIVALAAIHYYLSFKITTVEIGLYLILTAVLLGYRLVRPRLMERRKQKRKLAMAG
jgi:methionine sulfoxide reductase heme-binding subunit